MSRYMDAVLADSPVLYLRLNESSGTVAYDRSGNGLNGTYQNTPLQGETGPLSNEPDNPATRFRQAQSEDITIADNNLLDLGDTFTLECWVKRAGLFATHGYQTIIGKGNNGYGLQWREDNAPYLVRDSQANLARGAPITDLTSWHHIMATKSGATRKVYVDGQDQTVLVSNQTVTNTALALKIGSAVGGLFGNQYCEAWIAEIALYPTALALARAEAHYDAAEGGRIFRSRATHVNSPVSKRATYVTRIDKRAIA